MDDKHLIVLGIRGVPAAHGGFESFAERFVPWMVCRGWKVTVYCQGSSTGDQYEDFWEGCRRVHIPTRFSGALGTIEFDVKSTWDVLHRNGTILTLGYNTGFLSLFLRIKGRTNFINMDGIEWRRAKYSLMQKAYLWLNERMAASAGTLLIADHPEIAGHHGSHVPPEKIAMIPYGGDLIETADEERLVRLGLTRDAFFTLIARPEPENSVIEIVRAFSRRPRGVKMVVLGKYSYDHAYQRSVRAAASTEVLFPGAIYDKADLHALRLFGIAYLHGHQVGGTNPSLVEALGAGNAIVAHDNPFNRWVAGDAGLYFADEDACDRHISSLIASRELRLRLRNEARGRWAEEFIWDLILEKYAAVLERRVG